MSRNGGPVITSTTNTDETVSVKFETKTVPVFATASMNSMQHIEQLRAIYEKYKQEIPSFKLTITNVGIASGEE